jgi:hypothetical protein
VLLLASGLTACTVTHDVVEEGPDGSNCIDPGNIVKRGYWSEGLTRYETYTVVSFSVPGYTSEYARVSYEIYLPDAVTVALRDYAAARPQAVSPAPGGLEKVDGWYDPKRSTLRHPLLVHAPGKGSFLVEPGVLSPKGEGAFFLECRATDGGTCIRHTTVAGRSVEIAMTADDQLHWSDADGALRTAVQSVMAPCIP